MELSLRQMDLNLLVTLRELIRTRSVSETAKSLGVTQPAISNALSKLRDLLGDPILVKAPKGYILTARAQSIDRPLCNALSSIQTTLQPPKAFDPVRSKRRFTVAMTDYAEVAFAPAIIAAFYAEAPNCLLGIRRIPNYTLVEELTRGDLDLCCAFAVDPAPGLMVKRLYTDRFVSIIRKDHPASIKEMTLEHFMTLNHALVSPIIENPDTEFEGVLDDQLKRQGRKKPRRVMLSVPHFELAASVVNRANFVMTVPERVANRYKDSMHLRVFETPVKMIDFETNLVWHERNNAEPGIVWMRQLISKAIAEESTTHRV